MTTIWKYRIEITEAQTITAPEGMDPIHVGLDPDGFPCIWAIVNPSAPLADYPIMVVGTGNPMPSNYSEQYSCHLGTFLQPPFVWHVFWA